MNEWDDSIVPDNNTKGQLGLVLDLQKATNSQDRTDKPCNSRKSTTTAQLTNYLTNTEKNNTEEMFLFH